MKNQIRICMIGGGRVGKNHSRALTGYVPAGKIVALVETVPQVGEETAYNCMLAAFEAGVNFFDNAEAYARGNAEIVMGNVIKKAGWKRSEWSSPTARRAVALTNRDLGSFRARVLNRQLQIFQ